MANKKLTVSDEETGIRFTLTYDLDKPFPDGQGVIEDAMLDNLIDGVPATCYALEVYRNDRFVVMNTSCYESVLDIIKAMFHGSPKQTATGNEVVVGLRRGLDAIKAICTYAQLKNEFVED